MHFPHTLWFLGLPIFALTGSEPLRVRNGLWFGTGSDPLCGHPLFELNTEQRGYGATSLLRSGWRQGLKFLPHLSKTGVRVQFRKVQPDPCFGVQFQKVHPDPCFCVGFFS